MTSALLQALISALVGGVWIGLFTLLAERAGERIGGLLGGLPSIVLVSYFFIGLMQGDAALFGATTSFPVAYTITAVATWLYIVAAGEMRERLLFMMVVWFLGQGVLVAIGFDNFEVALLIFVIFLLAFVGFLTKRLPSYALPPMVEAVKTKRIGFLPRAALGAAVVGTAVFLSAVAGPIYGAIMAAFPGTIISSILIAERSRGPEFTRALLLALIFSGSINCMAFMLLVRLTVMELGTITAVLIAMLTTLATVFATRMAYDIIASQAEKRAK